MRGPIWIPVALLTVLAVPIPCAGETAEESYAAMEKALSSSERLSWETTGEMSDNGVREMTFAVHAFFGAGGCCRVETQRTVLDAAGAPTETRTNLLVCDGRRVYVENAGKAEPVREVAEGYAQSVLAVFARAGWTFSRAAAFDRGGPENFGPPEGLALAESKDAGRLSVTFATMLRPGNGSEGMIQQALEIEKSTSLPVERRIDLEGMVTTESYRGYSNDGGADPAIYELDDAGRPVLGFGERGAKGADAQPAGEGGFADANACVEAMFAACKAGDAALLAKCFASNCQKDFTRMLGDPKETAAFMEELSGGKVTGEVSKIGDHASVPVVWMRRGKEHAETIRCVKEADGWKIIDF